MLKLLKDFGLSEKEAKIFIHLSKTGPNKARTIASQTKMNRVQLYATLKTLQKKGMVESTFEYPTNYNAVPFSKVLDLFIKTKEEEVHILQTNKEEILLQWEQIPVLNNKNDQSKFMVLQGRKYVYSKIKQMVSQSKESINIVTSSPGVVQSYQAGVLDTGFNHDHKTEVYIRFLTNFVGLSPGLTIIKELIKRVEKEMMCVDIRITDLGSGNFPRFVITDEKELIFFLKPTEDITATNRQDTGLWTNNKILVHAFQAFFEELWRNSEDFIKKMRTIDKNLV